MRMNSNPNQNPGMAWPATPAMRMIWSIHEPRYRAAMTPSGTPTTRVNARASPPSSSVLGSDAWIISRTGRLYRNDRPKSPVSRCPSQLRYWIGSGRSRPYAARSAAISSARKFCAPNINSTGSPGARRKTVNASSVIPKKVGIAWITRLRTNRPISISALALLHPPRFRLGLALAGERARIDALELSGHAQAACSGRTRSCMAAAH